MANLGLHQKISRVLSSPFGDGVDGAGTISSDPNTRATITGTATQTTGTAGSSAFANGDLVLLHQTQGTGAGQWEINKVASGGGSTSLTFSVAHQYTYGTGAQIIKIPRYTTATVSAHSIAAWNGTLGGIEVLCANTSTTISGTIGGEGKGFRGYGTDGGGTQNNGQVGENVTNAGGSRSSSAVASGGGGGQGNGNQGAGGGGGGNATGGNYGETLVGVAAGGDAGGATGTADLISIQLGGAGGQGGDGGSGVGGAGGYSGGILMIFTENIVSISSIVLTGTAGGAGTGNTQDGGGGGGSGGSCLIVCNNANIGTSAIVATGGNGGARGGTGTTGGGAGSVGRIAIHHSGTVTGTTNPTFTDVIDTSLISLGNSARFYFM